MVTLQCSDIAIWSISGIAGTKHKGSFKMLAPPMKAKLKAQVHLDLVMLGHEEQNTMTVLPVQKACTICKYHASLHQ